MFPFVSCWLTDFGSRWNANVWVFVAECRPAFDKVLEVPGVRDSANLWEQNGERLVNFSRAARRTTEKPEKFRLRYLPYLPKWCRQVKQLGVPCDQYYAYHD